MSPFMVLFAVFLGAHVWGIFGAFIGVPILIAVLSICEAFERTRWLARLLSGQDAEPAERTPQGALSIEPRSE
jgi:predicted PurR-regulated permease PerM